MFRIHTLAQTRGMNITQLANKSGMAYSQVYGLWVNRTKRPALSTLGKIAEALNVPVWALFADAPEVEQCFVEC